MNDSSEQVFGFRCNVTKDKVDTHLPFGKSHPMRTDSTNATNTVTNETLRHMTNNSTALGITDQKFKVQSIRDEPSLAFSLVLVT